MKLIHNLGILSIDKEVDDDVGFLLANKKGSYCSFFGKPSSRYHGFFYFDVNSMNMYKFIENIEIVGNDNSNLLKNNFYYIERRKNDDTESFFMPNGYNSLIYELCSENDIDLFLDCKNSYDNREYGRYYEIFEENDVIVVEFTKKTDSREDSTNAVEEFSLYLAIKSDNNFHKKNNQWIERHYYADQLRNSPPYKRFIYNALRLKGSRFVFSISKGKKSAVNECEYVFNNLHELKNKGKEDFSNILKNDSVKNIITNERISKEIKIAYINAINALDNLMVNSKNFGVFAGLPWFFQFWARDALISLKTLLKIDKNFAEKVLYYYLNNINDDGRLPNMAGQHESKKLASADSIGWLFVRCSDVLEEISKKKEVINSIKNSIKIFNQRLKIFRMKQVRKKFKRSALKFFNNMQKKENEYYKLIYEIESSLEKSINGLLKYHTKDSFEINYPKETWMDTDYEGNDRNGIRIEIQALRLNMYKLMFELSQNHKYRILENTLKNRIKQEFFNGKILADGMNDFIIRPNIFIASYVYPKFLSNEEWETCFENALKALWLEWGGLSTIDKNNKSFTDHDTGEDARSYHRGNSWFWLNNLVAIELNKVNKNKFKSQIRKIISASTEDILWKGCIGCASELSPAKQLESKGCFNQAWSNAMYMELIDDMFK